MILLDLNWFAMAYCMIRSMYSMIKHTQAYREGTRHFARRLVFHPVRFT